MSERPWVLACVGVGANLADPVAAVQAALHALAQSPDMRGLRASSLYRSAPVEADGPWYVNAVAQLQTRLTAPALLDHLQALEQAAGRQRPYRHAPRTLDLDLLFYGAARIDSARLTVPHPRWQQRAFVLWPLQELMPERVGPEALAQVSDQPIEPLRVPAVPAATAPG
jgi:2-amino-4-hydroxy-6-hydroxymethyldihydropteridine diphosphokinase